MARNRLDTLDLALLRPGRLDRKIKIPLPNEQARLEIFIIYAGPIVKRGDIGHGEMVLCVESGMFAIRAERDYVIEEDFM
jgi:26S proteasome regulatory subunit T4